MINVRLRVIPKSDVSFGSDRGDMAVLVIGRHRLQASWFLSGELLQGS